MALAAVAKTATNTGQRKMTLSRNRSRAISKSANTGSNNMRKETPSRAPSMQSDNISSRKSTFHANKKSAQAAQSKQKPNQAMRQQRPSPMPSIQNIQPMANIQPQQLREQPAANDNQETTETEDNSEQEQKNLFQQATQQARIENALSDAMGIQAQAEQPPNPAATAATDKVAKDMAKKVVPRGAAFVGNGIANVLDLSTAGAALIIDFVVYAFSLGWLNFELLTGSLSWDPIPMPIDNDADLLKGLVIFLDLMVITAFVVLLALQVLFVIAMFSPLLLAGYFGTEGIIYLYNLFS